MNEVHKCGATIQSKEQELIRHVIECCYTEAQNKLLIPVSKATKRAAKYCKVSQCTIKKIRNEGKAHPNEVLRTLGQKRKRPENRNAVVDNFDQRVIQNVMQDFYMNLKTVPTCKKILPILKGENRL
jgi:hypothetical protein